MDNLEITFKKLYCIFKKDGFYIKSKFTISFSHSSKLFQFSAPFSIISAELNAASMQISTTQKFSPKLMENQIFLWHIHIDYVTVSGFPKINKTVIIPFSL